MLDKKSHYSEIIKSKAKALGFLSYGISKADFLEKEAPRLEQWLNQNHHGEMSHMANHFDKRLDPRVLVPGAKVRCLYCLIIIPKKNKLMLKPQK